MPSKASPTIWKRLRKPPSPRPRTACSGLKIKTHARAPKQCFDVLFCFLTALASFGLCFRLLAHQRLHVLANPNVAEPHGVAVKLDRDRLFLAVLLVLGGLGESGAAQPLEGSVGD